MAVFKDKSGNEWELSIVAGQLPRLREAGLNIAELGRDSKAYEALYDPETLGRILWVLCGIQAEKRGLNEERFANEFDGPTLWRSFDALGEAITDFSHRPRVAERVKAKLAGVHEKIEAAALTAWETKMETISANPIGLIASVGSSEARPESTPAG